MKKNVKKNIVTTGLCFCLMFAVVFTQIAFDKNSISVKIENHFVLNSIETNGPLELPFENEDIEKSIPQNKGKTRFTTIQLPSSYDLRDSEPGLVELVRDQGSYGSCWAFGALGSASSSLVKKGIKSEVTGNTLLSPYQLAYAAYNEKTFSSGTTSPLDAGGNGHMAVTAMSKNFAPEVESDFPYSLAENGALTNFGTAKYHLKNELLFASPREGGIYSQNNVNVIKQGVISYGALYTSYYSNEGKNTYLSGQAVRASYYYPNNHVADHAVVIIGYDDNYSKNNFKNTPQGNGAFLIQNSWGADWGNDGQGNGGYFWLSYYDKTIGESAYFELEEKKENTVDYYDDLGYYGNAFYEMDKNKNLFALNTFVAKNKGTLSSISLYTLSSEQTVSISIYKNIGNNINNLSSKKAAINGNQASYDITFSEAGYHKVTLPNSLSIGKGEKYGVMINFGNDYSPIESKNTYDDYVKINRGESYMGNSENDYEDLVDLYSEIDISQDDGYGNFCIKAYLQVKGADESIDLGRDDSQIEETQETQEAQETQESSEIPEYSDTQIKVTPKSSDVHLGKILISAGKLNPEFSEQKTNYKLTTKKSSVKITLGKSKKNQTTYFKKSKKSKYIKASSVTISKLKKKKSYTVFAKVQSEKGVSKVYKIKIYRQK